MCFQIHGLSLPHLPSLANQIIPVYRIVLNTGGDDVTELLYVLLQQTCFPYKELDLAQLYYWNLMEDLKQATCSFAVVWYLPSKRNCCLDVLLLLLLPSLQ